VTFYFSNEIKIKKLVAGPPTAGEHAMAQLAPWVIRSWGYIGREVIGLEWMH